MPSKLESRQQAFKAWKDREEPDDLLLSLEPGRHPGTSIPRIKFFFDDKDEPIAIYDGNSSESVDLTTEQAQELRRILNEFLG